jgi:hypothetical protein
MCSEYALPWIVLQSTSSGWERPKDAESGALRNVCGKSEMNMEWNFEYDGNEHDKQIIGTVRVATVKKIEEFPKPLGRS